MNKPLSRSEWVARAETLTLRTQAFINGKFVDARSGKRFDCISPIDGRVLAQVSACDQADVDYAVQSARQAFESGVWSRMAPAARKKILLKFSELMLAHRDELALLETLDMGKPIADSLSVDVPAAANAIAWNAEAIDKIYDEIAPSEDSAIAMVTREPLGVVAAVVPWNFPLLMACWKLGPALATGNSVVLKPAEQSPLSVLRLAELAMDAGLPPGVLNVVPGFGETAGRALGLHGDVDAVTFTGSTEVGKYFLKYAGESNMKRVSLECGGKSPNIVFADAPDLDEAAKQSAFNIFFNQGEMCSAASRLLVEESIKDAFLEKVLRYAETMRPGHPLDPQAKMGALVDAHHTRRVMDYIDQGKKGGARLLTGGKTASVVEGGCYVEPTIFADVRNDMPIAQQEIFGPVLSVIPFKAPDEALKIANDSIYGLAAAVWTRDINKAFRFTKGIRAGIVWVNCYEEGGMTIPFGGFKQSGFGRDKSLHALEKYTQLKTTWIKLS